MNLLNITQLLAETGESPLPASFDAQLQKQQTRQTRAGKPYLELTFVDATNQATLKAWNNHPQFHWCESLATGSFVRLSGDWTKNQYGLDASGWDIRPLNEEERQDFLSGDPQTRAFQEAEYQYIIESLNKVGEPRLHALGQAFIKDYGSRFRRTAAARKNHHARRGGLVEHVAQMMRSATAFCLAYPSLNLDLLTIGILFHDCGKLWENNYAEDSFAQTVDLRGEMLGHIPLGLELVNRLWTDLISGSKQREWLEMEVPSEHIRLHLLHLIGSHHGTYEFGSPVLPRTPEAYALHHIDNFDAKYEMLKGAYSTASLSAPGIYEKQFPLPAGAVEPLPHWEETPEIPMNEAQQGTSDSDFLF